MRAHAGDRWRCSPTPIPSTTATCIPATCRATASTSTKQLAARYPYKRAYLPVEPGARWHDVELVVTPGTP